MSRYEDLPRPFFVLAPMDEVTDTVFRQVVAKLAPPDLFFTEFVNVDGLMSPGRSHLLKKLRFVPEEGKVVVQLWGLKPENFQAIAEQIADGSLAREIGLPEGVNFWGVDLNMGCPAKGEVKAGACSALIKMDNRELAGAIIDATKAGLDGKLPLSVKTRVGFSSVDMSWFDFLLRFDLAMLTVHGRTRKQMSKVPADWELIGKVRQMRDELGVDTRIMGNGDVESYEQGMELAERHKLDGVMIGRGIFHDPFVFSKNPHWDDCAPAERIAMYRQHVELFASTWRDGDRPVHTLNKFCKVYIQGFDGASSLRMALMMANSPGEIIELLDNHVKSLYSVETLTNERYDSDMNKTIKAIVFDSDGTIVDTRELIIQGYKIVLARHGLEHLASDHYIRQRLGKPVPETYEQILAGNHFHFSIDELAKEHDEVQNELSNSIKMYPHTDQILREWHERGTKLCLFTSGKNMMIERNFKAAGMLPPSELFDAIITADDGLAHKPEPDSILELLRRVDVAPSDAVIVGDHAYDMLAGARAHVGLKVGVLHGFGTSHELLTAGADFLANDLDSLNHLMDFATR